VRSRLFITVAAAVALLVAGAAGVYAYDSAHESTIAEGVTVAGVSVGGLDRAAARARLEERVVEPLKADVIVEARGREFTLTAERAKLHVDVDASIDEAIARSRDGNVLTRTVRGLTGGDVDADLDPRITFSDGAVNALVKRVRSRVDQRARDARVQMAGTGIRTVSSRTGLRLRADTLRGDVVEALREPVREARTVRAKVRRTKPRRTIAELRRRYGTVLAVDRGTYKLRLYKHLKLVKTYGIAVGQVGLETPAGRYTIQNKAVNPAWNVPNSAWAGDKAGTVVPGGVPENPLKARWMGIYDGAGIHGTDARGSIGTNASHGCIRMLVEDVIELYDQVPVGAPVYIA
jgi:lipoprotein-anchoring transpeptidase ErfK/SrfK